jgi:hypothetical protein
MQRIEAICQKIKPIRYILAIREIGGMGKSALLQSGWLEMLGTVGRGESVRCV